MPTQFTTWLKSLLEANFKSHRAFIRAAERGRDENSGVAYLSKVLAGQKPPPIDRVAEWAAALGLKGEERERFIELAELDHAPEAVAKRYLDQQARIKRLEAAVEKLENEDLD